jgi:hypothetical protein
MAVRVRFKNGDERIFHGATSATDRSGFIVVARYNPRRKDIEEVAVYPAADVSFAEVSDGERVLSVINGGLAN